MDDFYGATHRDLQSRFETTQLADTLRGVTVTDVFDEVATAFIESRDFFFLSTVDEAGQPTVSHKGGAPGFVRVIDGQTLVFPSYDGNGMFLSMGNIVATAKIGLLFMDFETPHRVRVHATAELTEDEALVGLYPGADLVVRAKLGAAFVNCSRYIHKHERRTPSSSMPDDEGKVPLASWKKIDAFQEALAPRDRGRAEAEGDVISYDEYAARVARGEA